MAGTYSEYSFSDYIVMLPLDSLGFSSPPIHICDALHWIARVEDLVVQFLRYSVY